jgi:DNA-binding transcriptional LysR family regulator
MLPENAAFLRKMIDDDLRLVAALAEHGSARKAANALRQHVATVYRRLAAIEARLGLPLFEKQGNLLVATCAGEEVVAAALAVEARIGEMNRKLAASQGRLEGELRITTTDTLLPLLVEAIGPFQQAYPAVEIQLTISNSMADLARREADVAIRPTTSPPDTLIGRRLAEYSFAAYTAPGTGEGAGWILPDSSLSDIPAAVYALKHVDVSGALRVNSLWAAGHACAAGLGQALLPTYLEKYLPLQRRGDPIPELRSAVWMLFHPDQRRSAKVRYFTAKVAPALSAALGPGPGPVASVGARQRADTEGQASRPMHSAERTLALDEITGAGADDAVERP